MLHPDFGKKTDSPSQDGRSRESLPRDDPPHRFRILVIDDNADAAETLSLLLEMEGHAMRMATDGPGGLQAAQEFLPEVVFVDIGMPGMNGYEVARALRKIEGMQHAVIVALSGWDTGRLDDGFDHHLVKPAMPDEIKGFLSALPVPRS